ncbi:DNA-binding protein [Pseudomonas frederiksbergensis]|uniref:DNA-binding protein n=1 Tax=Pseudomonas frederiksbergensis TaxID=104087 RepID=UPI000F46BDB9|nr:DNA-binding protein [Pseudomonas frederiksbergensis]
MARGGINKAVVQNARQALLAKGMHPSIDAVRVALGNTGSRTTISRYLKELESFAPRPAASRERMGEELTAMMESLLDRLMEEGEEAIAKATSAFDLERSDLQRQIVELQTELAAASREVTTQKAAIKAQSAELQTTQSSLQAELTRNAGLSQRCADLDSLAAEKDKQIQSLEEKHVHARGALEHYRESVKEQREQDQRRHESQLHEMQVEQRKLRETLALKQDDLTRLNRDNERLLGDARQQAKTLHGQEAQIGSLSAEVQGLRLSEAKSMAVAEQLREQVSVLREESKELQRSAIEANLREQEALALLASVQVENDQLHQGQGENSGLDEVAGGHEAPGDKPPTARAKLSKPSRK